MDSVERSHYRNVYDGMKTFPTNSDVLMAEINASIATLLYAQTTTYLNSSFTLDSDGSSDADPGPKYDAQLADETYRAGCASFTAGKLDEALQSLNLLLSKCPPDKTSAVAKLQELRAAASSIVPKHKNEEAHESKAILS
ncbi:hypothetical protein RJ641_006226 [Dillenia turbinata]|uniref:Uncharacterized protein n=1 Tax=Dillenia turbinata TaxID=194707 RepID=A0AAN8V4Z6_9MAGN